MKNTSITSASLASKPLPLKRRSAWERVGWSAVAILLSTTILIFAAFSFLAFLWLSNHGSHLWHKIMVTEWATRSVTISTLVLRFATDLQAGIVAAMLAALVLESSSVCLYRTSQVSVMRASSPQPRTLLDLIPAMMTADWTFGGFESIAYITIIIILVVTTTALQFSSTVLLSDLRLGQLPGLAFSNNASYDFAYTQNPKFDHIAPGLVLSVGGQLSYPLQPRTSTWLRNPPAFPTFAEYSLPAQTNANVDDTGTLLRTFLPYSDALSRETIRNYSGNAMVLDSRVSCQSPTLSDISIGPVQSGGRPYLGRMAGRFEPSNRDVEGLWAPASPLSFNCTLYLDKQVFTACQVTAMNPMTDAYTDNGGLMSEFWKLTDPVKQLGQGVSMWSLPLLIFQLENMTTNAAFGETVTSTQDAGHWTQVVTSKQTWNVSICYSSWTTADLEVEMYSDKNRSEPMAFWNAERGFYTQPDVHSQLGDSVSTSATPESRGILQLKAKDSWIPSEQLLIPNQVQPFVQQFADVSNQQVLLGITCEHCSALFAPSLIEPSILPPGVSSSSYYESMFVYAASTYPSGLFVVDSTLSSIVQQTLTQTGSLARALSSLITLMSGMAYYDQMPQFQQEASTEVAFFTTVLYPQAYMGFWAFGLVLASHLGLVAFITAGFAIRTRYTLLGNYWQAIAQILGPETEDLLSDSRLVKDQEVKEQIRVAGNENARVAIKSDASRTIVGLSVVKTKSSSSLSTYSRDR